MTLLPIVERELRVAARRKSTYRIRFWTAVAAMSSFSSLAFLEVTFKSGTAGHPLFTALTSCAFGLCLLAGVFLTADCLSSEKREGTLGLLFLTDLKGYDVVLGKFTALALKAFYGLLAIYPIMAVPLLMGGVTGGEFWRMTLALANALFLSLAIGILLSALSRHARLAIVGTFGLLIFLAGGLPVLTWFASLFGHPPLLSDVSWMSPTSPFWDAREMVYLGGPRQFWHSLLASHMLGWLFVALASLALPHCWQERPKAVPRNSGRWLKPRTGRPAERTRAPLPWLEINPVLWLVGRNRVFTAAAWTIALAWGAILVAETIFAPGSGMALLGNFVLARPFAFILEILFALETCRFFADTRRNGVLEMLLCTPLTGREIIHGQSLALRRTFATPLFLFVGISFLPALTGFLVSASLDRFASGFLECWAIVLFFAREATAFFAIYWFGLWLALTVKKPYMAGPLTILFVVILPAFFCMFDFVPHLFLISWGASRLDRNLRRLVAEEYQRAPANPLPRVVTNPSPAPPVIGG